jgi:hypothetical protein
MQRKKQQMSGNEASSVMKAAVIGGGVGAVHVVGSGALTFATTLAIGAADYVCPTKLCQSVTTGILGVADALFMYNLAFDYTLVNFFTKLGVVISTNEAIDTVVKCAMVGATVGIAVNGMFSLRNKNAEQQIDGPGVSARRHAAAPGQ